MGQRGSKRVVERREMGGKRGKWTLLRGEGGGGGVKINGCCLFLF